MVYPQRPINDIQKWDDAEIKRDFRSWRLYCGLWELSYGLAGVASTVGSFTTASHGLATGDVQSLNTSAQLSLFSVYTFGNAVLSDSQRRVARRQSQSLEALTLDGRMLYEDDYVLDFEEMNDARSSFRSEMMPEMEASRRFNAYSLALSLLSVVSGALVCSVIDDAETCNYASSWIRSGAIVGVASLFKTVATHWKIME